MRPNEPILQMQHNPQAPRTPAQTEAALTAQPASPAQPDVDVQRLLHDLQLHQVELNMQNEALRQSQGALEAARDRYADLYEFAPVGYLTLNAAGMIEQINLTAAALLGVERKHQMHRNFTRLVTPDDQPRWMQLFVSAKAPGSKGSAELVMWRGERTVFQAHIECAGQPLGSPPGTVRVVVSDISARMRAQAAQKLNHAALNAVSQGVVITGSDRRIVSVNTAFLTITGYSEAEILGRDCRFLQGPNSDPVTVEAIRTALRRNTEFVGEILNYRKDRTPFWNELMISPVLDGQGSLTHFVGVLRDITARKKNQAEIQRLAYFDVLTQLPNRRLLRERLEQAIAAAARNGFMGALCFIDLDNFKALNDSRGHHVGDLLLAGVAQRLSQAVRPQDTVSRQGGDEFVVLMEKVGSNATEATARAAQLGATLHAALAEPFNLNGYEYHCKASLGVGLFNGRDTITELFKHADLALYQAKGTGRDRLRFFDPTMQAALELRTALEAELRVAVQQGQLRLYYQPQLDGACCVVGVEALLRWQHPQRGLVAPDDFIPLAEETGLILPLGRWVLDAACAQIKLWESDAHSSALQVAVNVSARQFRQPDFVAQIQSVLFDSGIQPQRLKLELTESLVLDDVHDTIATMKAIKLLGVQFSVDDFGTGYSSLAYLAQLPLDQIKIDKSFVRNLPGVAKDATIARAIITMGLGLGLNVIAEGVETQSQRNFLETQGCHAYQGYLFSRPLPIETLEEYMQQNQKELP